MGWRGLAMLTLLLVLGAAGGLAMSRELAGASVGTGAAEPVATQSPSVSGGTVSVPSADPVVPRDDPTDDPLLPEIELTEATIGAGSAAITYPVPVGWKANHLSPEVVKWKKPGTSNNTYVMRVTDVRSLEQTPDEAIEAELAVIEGDPENHFYLVRQGPTSIEYTYISSERRLRHSHMRWVDLDQDGLVDLQVVVHGRKADLPGTSDLIERVVADVRPA